MRESNAIEGITRRPTTAEILAHEEFLALKTPRLAALEAFVSAVQPGARLRKQPGMNVRVGAHYPPPGGPRIARELEALLDNVARRAYTPYEAHVQYELLHSFTDGNGRSGRVLWLWMMNGRAPLGFLHTFYYQTLAGAR